MAGSIPSLVESPSKEAPLPVIDIDQVLTKLKLPEKILLLSGCDIWHTAPIPRLGIPSVRLSDGPNGVRGQKFFNGTPSSCFPCSTGLGSSWDVELAKDIGNALGVECKEKGVHQLLAPTVNTQRSPLGGRGFESFSEDPVLNGNIAAAYINGIQEEGVAATIKHFVANDQESERQSIDARVSERALREIYYKPFQIAIKKSNPWALMTAYGRLNGVHVSEDDIAMNQVLRKDWGWDGAVVSDWTGTYSTVAALEAGLHLEMPGPSIVRGAAVERALVTNKLKISTVDTCVRKILELVQRAQLSGIPFNAPEHSVDTPELRDLLRRAAAGTVVLLKNDASLLPLRPNSLSKPIRSLAVIGPNSKPANISGGGSAQLLPSYSVSPLVGITSAAKEVLGIDDVRWAIGAPSHRFIPLIAPLMKQSSGGEDGALVEFLNNPFEEDGTQREAAIFQTPTTQSYLMFYDNIRSYHILLSCEEKRYRTLKLNPRRVLVLPADTVNKTCWHRFSGVFVPDEDGSWEFGFVVAGQGNLYLDGKLVIDNTTRQELGGLFFGQGSTELRGIVDGLVAGREYALEVRSTNEIELGTANLFLSRGALRIGAWKIIDDEEAVEQAVELAASVDAVILVVGLNSDWESEGVDRTDLFLPGLGDQLVRRVLAANPNVVVVNQSGMPVEMQWLPEASTVVQAFYGGNELGNGLADVLFGRKDPSGKLAVSFPRHLSDNPSFISFPGENGKVNYNEGIYVAYRHPSFETIFPFGHGLTYSTFAYSSLKLPTTISSSGDLTFSITLTNTGSRFAREIVQVYVADKVSSLPRPEKELKNFVKIALAPGESKDVEFSLDRDAWGYYDDKKACWVAEKGTFEVRVAASSLDVRLRGEVDLEESFTWTGL